MVAGLGAICGLALTILVFAPLMGWIGVVRLPAVLVPALALCLVVVRPWRWRERDFLAVDGWQPSTRAIRWAAVIAAILLFWIVVTRFRSGEINAVDFTVYFDRPCYQTIDGRPLFVETTDDPRFSNRTELTDHAYWAMLPICAVYGIYPSPYWLLALSVAAVVAGAVYAGRVVQHVGGGGVLAVATALAFVLNDNTARTLNYGFHPEVLFAWFIPWMIDAGLRRHRAQFLAAAFACVLVKESAVLHIFAATGALAFIGWRAMGPRQRLLYLALPNVIALGNLALYYGWLVPRLTATDVPSYSYFWENYGSTPLLALIGMAGQPWRVVIDTATSGFFSRVITPHLFLPLVGWQWMAGTVPLIAIFSAAAAEQVRAFGIYYAIPLVPFLTISASMGALAVARRFVPDLTRARAAAAVTVVAGAVLVGSGDRGYSLRPWKQEIAAVPDALTRLSAHRVVLVQSGLFPHAGYSARYRLLTRESLESRDGAGAAILLAPAVNAYPFERQEIEQLADMPRAAPMPRGLIAVQLPDRHKEARGPRQTVARR
jgi:uncharacterized membrane protein